jgi:hypothetical protein
MDVSCWSSSLREIASSMLPLFQMQWCANRRMTFLLTTGRGSDAVVHLRHMVFQIVTTQVSYGVAKEKDIDDSTAMTNEEERHACEKKIGSSKRWERNCCRRKSHRPRRMGGSRSWKSAWPKTVARAGSRHSRMGLGVCHAGRVVRAARLREVRRDILGRRVRWENSPRKWCLTVLFLAASAMRTSARLQAASENAVTSGTCLPFASRPRADARGPTGAPSVRPPTRAAFPSRSVCTPTLASSCSVGRVSAPRAIASSGSHLRGAHGAQWV